MKYAYVREGLVEFIEERQGLERLYPAALLPCFVPLDESREKAVCKGWRYEDGAFTEPEFLSPIPTVGGYYVPNDKDAVARQVLDMDRQLQQQITDLELENLAAQQEITDLELTLLEGGIVNA